MTLSKTSFTVQANSGQHTLQGIVSYTALGTTVTGIGVTVNNPALVTGTPSGNLAAGNVTFTTSQTSGTLILGVSVLFGGGGTVPQSVTITIQPYPNPLISSFTPATGPGCGVVVLTLSGSGFGEKLTDITDFRVGTTPCASITYKSSQEVLCDVPATATTGKVVLETFQSSVTSVTDFIVDPKTREQVEHVVPALTPSKIPVTVTITGAYMLNTFQGISVAGTNCTDIQYKTKNLITCKTIAPGQYTSGEVKLLRPGPSPCPVIKGPTFTFAGPNINTIEPTRGPTYGFRQVVVRGSYLGASPKDITEFKVAGVDCLSSLVYIDSTQLKCTPANITGPGSGPVVISTKDGGTGTSTSLFEYFDSNQVNPADRPVIQSITPTAVSYLGGESITIVGQKLGNSPDDLTALLVNGDRWENDCVWVDSSRIICVTRAGTVGSKSINVETKSGSRGLTEKTLQYTFVGALELKSNSLITDEDGKRLVEATVTINQKPRFPVTVRMFSNDTSEGKVSLSELFFATATWELPRTFTIEGVPDDIRDGDQSYNVNIQVESDDTVFEGLFVPPLQMTNLESFPILDTIVPAAAPFSGREVTVYGRNFDAYGMRAQVEGKLFTYPQSLSILTRNKTVTSAAPEIDLLSSTYSSPRARSSGLRVLQQSGATVEQIIPEAYAIVFQAPPAQISVEGNRPLVVFNADGKNVTSELLIFYTDNCPDPGQFGRGSNCVPCPAGGICKGGTRMWPKKGYWNPSEDTGEVQACLPAIRCLGCEEANAASECYAPTAPCAPEYTGDVCALCAKGFYETNSVCEECPSIGDLIILTLVNVAIWVTVAIAGAVLEDRENFSHMLGFVVAVQEVAAVGQMLNSQLPKWLRGVYENLYIFAGDISFLKPECLGSLTPDVEFALSIFYNILIGVPLIVGVPLMRMLSRKLNAKKSEFYKQNREDHYHNRFRRTFTIHLRLIYFAVMQKCVDTLSCEKSLGKYVLVTNPSYECFQGTHFLLVVVSIGLIIALGVGYPYWYFRLMRRNMDKLYTDVSFMEKFDFIYDPYIRSFKFLWMLELFFQVLVAVGATSLSTSPNAQFVVLAGAFGVNIVLQLGFRPMRRGWENYVIAAFNAANLLAMIIIWLSGQDKLSTQALDMMIYALLVLLVYGIGSLAFVMFYYILWVWQPRSLYHTRRAKKEAVEFEEDVGEEMELMSQFIENTTRKDGTLNIDVMHVLNEYQDETTRRKKRRGSDSSSGSQSGGDVGHREHEKDMESMAIRLMFAGADGDPEGSIANLPRSSFPRQGSDSALLDKDDSFGTSLMRRVSSATHFFGFAANDDGSQSDHSSSPPQDPPPLAREGSGVLDELEKEDEELGVTNILSRRESSMGLLPDVPSHEDDSTIRSGFDPSMQEGTSDD
eukprot:TRINITY_DN2494_c0_g1_i1.p1 TRINITY_DN2494_c0_g1~~TRINITY_DN2494_c0_g1_i1.p1  ORF type:complete len:1396 (-),score=273.64 TRINITY_DN2494_c0_g1_i1:95-4282(-)